MSDNRQIGDFDRQLRLMSDSEIDRLVSAAPEHAGNWDTMDDAQRLAWRARNEHSRRGMLTANDSRQEAAWRTKRKAELKAQAERDEVAAKQRRADFDARLRRNFAGTDADFKKISDELWQRDLLEKSSTDARERAKAALLAAGGYDF